MGSKSLLSLDDDEWIVDLFAGGGGWSLGIEIATGRSPDVAVNHDLEAISMHEANHPKTVHYREDVRDVDPTIVCRGHRVGLLVMSPDCTHFSRARNGSIRRSKEIRSLANVAHRWAATVRPRIILLECVAELETWGPLDEHGQPIKEREGESFDLWWQRLEAMGYRLSKRLLKACDYGAPTSRGRLFIIASCDPDIEPEAAWPEPTHGPGRAKPWRTAAECIDYSLPCPSIFMTAEEARAFTKATGIRCKRPLADKTMQRIRRGIYKYVINCAKPFLVPTNHGGEGRNDNRVYDATEPMRTVTCAHRGEAGVVQPFVVPAKSWGGGGNDALAPDRPMRTITTSKRGEFGVVTPIVTSYYGDSDTGGNDRASSPDSPLPTQTCANRFGLVAPTLVQTGYGERPGQAPRCLDIGAPLGTIIAGGGGNGNGKHGLVSAFLAKNYSQRDTGGWNGGQPVTEPMSSVTCKDHHSLVAGHMVKLRGTSDAHIDASSASYEAPVPTISANGNHVGEVRAFLAKYYGTGESTSLFDPLDTVTTKDRFGLVMVDGQEYVIVDIGFRMLTPRELFRAQGFPDTYIIDPMVEKVVRDKRGQKKTISYRLTRTGQVEKVGNSVCPPLAAAIVTSVFAVREKRAAA